MMTWRETISWYLPALVLFGGWLFAVVFLVFRKRWVFAVALGCVWLLAMAISLPSLKPAGPESRKRVCISNMQQIQDAKKAWAEENKTPQSDEVTDADLEKYFKNSVPRCPIDDRSYRLGKVGELPICPNAKERGHVFEPAKQSD